MTAEPGFNAYTTLPLKPIGQPFNRDKIPDNHQNQMRVVLSTNIGYQRKLPYMKKEHMKKSQSRLSNSGGFICSVPACAKEASKGVMWRDDRSMARGEHLGSLE